ncbi:hypothetical protein BKA82DRAFT_4013870 [Pisolithus tinctorius]|nr:hypothetical protein BKA82DRAFT_4013870 [Pisolithus tinctorius]
MFRVFSPPPRGLELERDDVPVRHQMFRRLVQDSRESLTQVFVKVIDRAARTDTSKIHMGDSVLRTLPAEDYPTTRQGKLLNFGQNTTRVLPGMELPPLALVTGFVPATSNATHLPHVRPPNSMRTTLTPLPTYPSTARAFCRHQKAIRSRNDCVSWFSSQDSYLIETPPSSPDCYSHALQNGDLFVHTHNDGRQAWMWRESGWTPVQEAGSGEPSWVTGKTMATYRAKNRKCYP